MGFALCSSRDYTAGATEAKVLCESVAKVNELKANEIEAANRAEATALLIRAGYRVYRPEADCYGEDLVVRSPSGELCAVQLKARPTVDKKRYGEGTLWMLFPDPNSIAALGRKWFLLPHGKLYEWVKAKHGHTPKWNETWSYPTISKELGGFLEQYTVIPRRSGACATSPGPRSRGGAGTSDAGIRRTEPRRESLDRRTLDQQRTQLVRASMWRPPLGAAYLASKGTYWFIPGGKIRELARRGKALGTSGGKADDAYAIEVGRGSMYLRLTWAVWAVAAALIHTMGYLQCPIGAVPRQAGRRSSQRIRPQSEASRHHKTKWGRVLSPLTPPPNVFPGSSAGVASHQIKLRQGSVADLQLNQSSSRTHIDHPSHRAYCTFFLRKG
jgi:hypothetical protein